MLYLIIDPTDEYAARMVGFLGRMGHKAIAVLSDRRAEMYWNVVFTERLGKYVLDTYSAEQAPSKAALAWKIGRDWPQLSGIIPWDERTVMLGADLSDRLGLGWNTAEIIERCRDKYAMKAWLRSTSKVRVNASRVVHDAASAIDFAKQVGKWPIVVKPTGGAGSIDVFFANDESELLGAGTRVMRAGAGDCLLEEYIGGTEHAVNGLVDANGDVLLTDVWRYDRREVNEIPNLYVQAWSVPTTDKRFSQLGQYATEVITALGLKRSPFHMELKLDERGPCLIEVGARFAGGELPWLASKLHGRNLFELAACHYLAHMPLTAKEIDYEKYNSRHARTITGIQKESLPMIREVHGLEMVKKLPSYAGHGLVRKPGKPAPLTIDYDTRAWELYMIHEEFDQVEMDTARAWSLLKYS